MKKILLILSLIMLLTGCNSNLKKEDTIKFKDYDLSIVKKDDCYLELKKYYTDNDRNVYLACLDEVYINDKSNMKTTLKQHFSKAFQTLDDSINNIIQEMKMVDALNDGGSAIYRKDDLTIYVCKTLGGNRDVYIGDGSLDYYNINCGMGDIKKGDKIKSDVIDSLSKADKIVVEVASNEREIISSKEEIKEIIDRISNVAIIEEPVYLIPTSRILKFYSSVRLIDTLYFHTDKIEIGENKYLISSKKDVEYLKEIFEK